MKKLAIIGVSSFLSKSLIKNDFLSDYDVKKYGRGINNDADIVIDCLNLNYSYIKKLFEFDESIYIFNLGFLMPKNIKDASESQIVKSLKINSLFIIKCCEIIFDYNRNARVFILGSESSKKGSFDTTYFLSKAMLVSYVKERYLYHSNQQLLLFSPSTIEDSYMTINRSDTLRLNKYRNEHRKKRFITNDELSDVIVNIIKSTDYISNCEIEINGGKFARLKY